MNASVLDALLKPGMKPGKKQKTPEPDPSQEGLFDPKSRPPGADEMEAREVLRGMWREVSRVYDSIPQGWGKKAAFHAFRTNPGLAKAETAIEREYRVLEDPGTNQERKVVALRRIKEGTAFYSQTAGSVFLKAASRYKNL